MALTEADSPLTPDWWLLRLGKKIRARSEKQLKPWWRYYSGDHPLPQGPRKARDAFVEFQKKARTNFCRSAVRADVHRLMVIGITDSDGRSDDEAWRWWQINNLDSRQKQLFRLCGWAGTGYIMVSEHPDIERQPLITIEHPREAIVELDPRTGARRAGLKLWYDDVYQMGRAQVLLNDGSIHDYETDVRGPGQLPMSAKAWTLVDEGEHGIGRVVPLVPVTAGGDLDEDPEPTFYDGIDIQDRLNLGLLNRMSAERYGAFRQRWVTGHVFDKESETITDPASGLEVVVARVKEMPFQPGPANLWASEGQDTKFGEFGQTDLSGYLRSHQADIADFFFVCSLPAYYMPMELTNVSADTVQALDVNHVAKVEEEQGTADEGLEEAISLAGRVAQSEADRSSIAMRWKNPRQINPAVVADAAAKQKGLGIPTAMIAEDMGWSPQRVARLRTESAAEELRVRALALQHPRPTGPPATGGAGG